MKIICDTYMTNMQDSFTKFDSTTFVLLIFIQTRCQKLSNNSFVDILSFK